MKKSIYALTAALALASPMLTLEAKAGSSITETARRVEVQRQKMYSSQPKTVYRNETPVIEREVDLTQRSSDKYIRNANLETRTEIIPTPAPEPKPVQSTPMLVQGQPATVNQQNVYNSNVTLPSPTVIAQPIAAVPVRPVVPGYVPSCSPGYVVCRTCDARPFGGLFRGIGIGLRWLFAGPMPRIYAPGTPFYPAPMVHPPMIGPGMARPIPMRPIVPYAPYRPFW